MINFLRHNLVASILLTIARVYLGFNWMMDGYGKLTSKPAFSAAGLINGAIKGGVQNVAPAKGQMYPLWTAFLKTMTNGGKNTQLFDFLVKWGELLVGIALILGAFTLFAAFAAILMNYSFMLSGVVSINPIYILLEFFILIGGFNSAKIGLDRFITPWLRKNIPFLRKHGETEVRIENAINSYK
ncbi:MAG: DoxX family membrane protein [Lactobacillaceae bacterium]|jgi:thiosulfate dehydrogenase [quinone] large subunit|nr:DoxX family membrane protein [Lactobacillaceae bacterium]